MRDFTFKLQVIVDVLIGMLSNNLKSKPIVGTVFKLVMGYLTEDAVQVLIDVSNK